MAYPEQSFTSLLKELISEIGQLIRQELRLAQAEAAEKVSQAQNGVVALIVGLLFAFSALLILLQAVVVALATVVPAWLASVIVGLVVAVIAFILVRQGQSNLKPVNLVPERTLNAVRTDKDMVMRKVNDSTKQVA
jgi:uncharacterized membrane protein YgcG